MNIRRDKWVIRVCLGVFIVGVLIAWIHQNSLLLGTLDKLDNDDVRYIRSGQQLLETGRLIYYNPTSTLTAFIMPGLPVLLAGIMKLFGTGDTGVQAYRVFQALLTSCSVAMVYFIARQLYNQRIARISLILIAAYMPIYYVGNLVLTETCFTFTMLLFTYSLVVAEARQWKRDYVYVGLALAAAIYFRPTAALLPLTIGLMWLIRRVPFKIMCRHALILGVTVVICLSPWWIRNAQVFHEFIPLTNSSANPFLLGMLINEHEPSDFIRDHAQIYESYRHGSEAQQKELAMMIFKYQFLNHPIIFGLWIVFGKLLRLIIIPFYWAPVLGIPIWLVVLQHGVYLIASIAGLWTMVRQRKLAFLAFFGVLTYFIAVYLPFITMERYFYPTMWLMMIPLAVFVESRIGKTRFDRTQLPSRPISEDTIKL
ncbi:4-amino-4-deoxy-L-arabinose transferase-like glycosyltransferase [Paenibacillus shirakamiensis]|uniref:4-amino-4-deoxy-L-arabinose transferase-like glycosyltransferase n=1 Tax=Paenibacillus shirakamiensis TaxID=1265935 RepID=A0ABS4JD51_9BACL|nr:glycosyltransferase family 39 protein [Paenibacillus shirakamiensis]MBP1999639.1 4-amino-4-deoxy-L-arabinose transferase-like glycosyltransferase [Paenibacillus shirakamiensis]